RGETQTFHKVAYNQTIGLIHTDDISASRNRLTLNLKSLIGLMNFNSIGFKKVNKINCRQITTLLFWKDVRVRFFLIFHLYPLYSPAVKIMKKSFFVIGHVCQRGQSTRLR